MLDELWQRVDFQGVTIKLNKYAGGYAVKFFSPWSFIATLVPHRRILIALAYFAILDYEKQSGSTILPEALRFLK